MANTVKAYHQSNCSIKQAYKYTHNTNSGICICQDGYKNYNFKNGIGIEVKRVCKQGRNQKVQKQVEDETQWLLQNKT